MFYHFLAANLIGDFMVELKKAGEDSMIVRAARAKLVAKDSEVSLQGMDRKGPVDVILAHGNHCFTSSKLKQK